MPGRSPAGHLGGSRSTGSGPGVYVAVGPGWKGGIPDGFAGVLPFETDLVFIIGRSQLFGPDDVEALCTVMDGYRLRQLSSYLGAEPVDIPKFDWPVWDDPASRDERFIGYVNRLLEWCQPTHPSEGALMDRFSRIGIGAGLSFDQETLDDETRSALRDGRLGRQ